MIKNQKNCCCCGRFFIPDKRIGARQKSCSRPECKKKRKKISQAVWFSKNPTYYKDRYDNYTKDWLARNPGYLRRRRQKRRDIQDECPHLTPMKSMRLLMPVNWLKSDIQDKYLVLTLIDKATYAARWGW